MAAAPATTTLSPQQLDGSAMAPPPGFKPNYVDPPNLEREFFVDGILCLTISVLVVCMHMWTKAHLVKKVQIEDCKRAAGRLLLPHLLSHCPFLFLPPPHISPTTDICVM